MREPGRDVVATIGNPKKFDVSGEVDVLVLAKQGAFTQVDVRIGPDLQGIGWVSNDALEPMTSSGSVAGFLKGSEIKEPNYTYYTCNENLPLWADVHGELHEFGLIKKGGKFRGAPNPQGDFRVNLGDRVDWSSEVPFTNAWDPFVGKERLESAGCKTMSKEQYLR